MAFLKEYFQIKNWVPYDQAQRRRMMTFVLWSILVAGILLGLVNLYLKALGAGLILFALSILCIAGLRLNRAGHYLATGILVSLMVLIALDFNLIDGNGSRDTGIVALPIFVIIGTLLFGKRSTPAFALAAVGSAIVVTYLSVHGDIPRAYHASFNDGITISILVVVSAVLVWVIMDTLEKDVERIRQSETNLRTSYDLTLQNLEKLKMMDEALHASEEKFRRLFETSRDFLYITNLDGEIIEVNQAASTLSGYSVDELKKINIQKLYFDPNDRDLMVKEISGRGFMENLEVKGKRKDGTVVDALVNSTVIKDDDGKVVGFQGSIKDITERKQAEEALQESEARYRAISELMSDYTFSTRVESDGKIVPQWVAGAFQQITGYPWEEFIALGSWPRIVYPDDLPVDQLDLEALLENQPINRELRIVTKSGEVRWIQNFVRPVWNDQQGRVTELIGAVRDISERKRAEEALRESEQKFRGIVEQASDGIVLTDEHGHVAEWNRAQEQIIGKSAKDVIGQPLWDIQFQVATPDHKTEILKEQIKASMLDCLQTGQAPWLNQLTEQVIQHPDGTHRIVQSMVFPIKRKTGFLLGSVTRDITERKQAEEALHESEERYSRLSAATSEGIVISDQGRIMDANPQLAKMLLNGDDPGELIGLNSMDFVAPESRNLVMANMNAGFEGPYEHLAIKKDGTIFPVEIRARAIYYKGRQTRVTIIRDITDRKRAEDALRHSEERLSSFMDAASDSFYLLDSDLCFVEINQRGLEIAGKKKEDIIGKSIIEIVPDVVESGRYEKHKEVIRTGKPFVIEDFIPHPVFGPMHFILKSFKVGNGLGVIASDITERKRAEDALKESEKLFRALIENSTDAIIMVDRAWIILYVSPSHERITGYRPEQRLVRDLFEVIHPDDCETVSQLLVGILEVPGQVNLAPIRARHADGSWHWIEAVARNLLNEPSVQAVVINFRDITERKRAEEQIKKALAEKENLLRELYHRTKNNMGVIIALLELQSGYFDDERLQAAFTDTENRIRSMALVHQKLYETSDLSHINLKDYINELMQLLMNSYRTSPERVSFVVDMEDVLVLIDTAIPCGLVLNELISNAFKHAFPAGKAGQITVYLRRLENGAIQLRVADDGVGLPPGFDVSRDGQMGLKTIFALAEHQLKAQVSFDTQQGVSCQLQFKDNLYQPRI